MAEFGMHTSASYNALNQQPFHTSVPAGGMDWYTPSASASAYGNTGYGTNYNMGPATGYGTTANFEDEPPLLEELGIDISGILKKTRSVLFHRLNSKLVEDLDMGGALIFVFALAALHLLMGKLHFGVVLGWSVVHSMVLWFIINQLAGAEGSEAKGLDLYSICCVVGYCQVPLVVYSAISLLVPRAVWSLALAALCTIWSATTASKILARRCSGLDEVQGLITLPCLLLYSAFAMLCLY